MPAGERTALLLLTRDLRLHDNPALAAAREAGRVVPLFVLDERLLRLATMGANRLAFLLESLSDLRTTFRRLGSELVVRRGDPSDEIAALASAVGGDTLHMTEDVSFAARRRMAEVEKACARAGIRPVVHPGVGVVEPAGLRPSGRGDHYRVFTPYFRAWSGRPRRSSAATPRRLPRAPSETSPGAIPTLAQLGRGGRASDPVGRVGFRPLRLSALSPGRAAGGETSARHRLESFLAGDGAARYEKRRDELAAADATTRLSAALHFGCLSPLELETRARAAGGEALARQLCWRDFYLGVMAAVPSLSWADYRTRDRCPRVEDGELEA